VQFVVVPNAVKHGSIGVSGGVGGVHPPIVSVIQIDPTDDPAESPVPLKYNTAPTAPPLIAIGTSEYVPGPSVVEVQDPPVWLQVTLNGVPEPVITKLA